MALLATLHDHRRSAERQAMDAAATLRVDGHPLDALVANISASGCLFVCSEPLEVGDTVTIGLAGIGRRGVHIVRALGSCFGAEFETALTKSEIEAALAVQSETVVSLPIADQLPAGQLTNDDEPAADKLSLRSRVLTIVGLSAVTWCVLVTVLVR